MTTLLLRLFTCPRIPVAPGLAALALGLPGSMTAADPAANQGKSWKDGWYADLSTGLSIIPAGDVTLANTTYEADFKDGLLLRGAAGRRLGPYWAVEAEWFYRSNSLASLAAGNRRFTGGDVASNNLFLNATFSPGSRFAWRGISPYAGVGFGWIQEVDLDLEGADGGEFSSGGSAAWQWSVGLRGRVGSRAELFLEGRAIAAGERKLEAPNGRNLRIEYDAWGLLAGLRWSF